MKVPIKGANLYVCIIIYLQNPMRRQFLRNTPRGDAVAALLVSQSLVMDGEKRWCE